MRPSATGDLASKGASILGGPPGVPGGVRPFGPAQIASEDLRVSDQLAECQGLVRVGLLFLELGQGSALPPEAA